MKRTVVSPRQFQNSQKTCWYVSAATVLAGIALAGACNGSNDDASEATPSAVASPSAIESSKSPTATEAPTPQSLTTEAFDGVPLPPGAKLRDSSVIDDTIIPLPFETELDVEFYTVLNKKIYDVPLPESQVTAFYHQLPDEWTLANDDKPIIWATDGGRRGVWILVFQVTGSSTLLSIDEGRVE